MRKDGKRIKRVDPMYTIVPYIMNKRMDSMNMITLDIPLEPMDKYLHKVRREGKQVSHLGLVLTAILRATAEYPALNRFVVNKRIYARNDFTVGMVVLKPGEDDGAINKVSFELEDDIFTVQDKMDKYIEENRKLTNENKTDKLMQVLLSVPGLVNFGVGLFKLLDRYGLLPKSIIDASPFHVTMVITNLASIRTNHIYHHIYEFGTTSMILSMGNSREVPKRVKGEIIFERCMPIGMVMDERICSGSYYATAFQRIKTYLKDPTLLEGAPKVVNRDFPKE